MKFEVIENFYSDLPKISIHSNSPVLRGRLPPSCLISKSPVLRETSPNFQFFLKFPILIATYFVFWCFNCVTAIESAKNKLSIHVNSLFSQ